MPRTAKTKDPVAKQQEKVLTMAASMLAQLRARMGDEPVLLMLEAMVANVRKMPASHQAIAFPVVLLGLETWIDVVAEELHRTA
jgi:hypothetical protein